MFGKPLLAQICALLVNLTVCLGDALNTKKELVIPGDIYIGAILPIHNRPSVGQGYSKYCGPIQEKEGIAPLEILLATLDMINDIPQVLPGLKLGAVVRDSCSYAPTAVESAMSFVSDYIASMDDGEGHNCSEHRSPPSVVGILGLDNEKLTQKVQSLLKTFNIPQMGLSRRKEPTLSNYLVRIAPPFQSQAKAMVDIIKKYNWTYVSLIQSADADNHRLRITLESMLKEEDVCIASSSVSPKNVPQERYDRIVESLMRFKRARVVVCLCDPMTIRRLLQAIMRQEAESNFVIIGINDWMTPEIVGGSESAAIGGVSVIPRNLSPDFFRNYFLSLRPESNTRNVWFGEYWEDKFNCTIGNTNETHICTGEEQVLDFQESSTLEYIFTGVYTLAIAFHAMQQDHCRGRSGLCNAIGQADDFINYIRNVSFNTLEEEKFFFDENGDGPARFDILNFQNISSPHFDMDYASRKVGSWTAGDLDIDDTEIQWPGINNSLAMNDSYIQDIPQSVCSNPCQDNEVKKVSFGSSCCWLCIPCPDGQIPVDDFTCSKNTNSYSKP